MEKYNKRNRELIMKKICFFVGNLNNSGGTERVCTIIANYLSKLNYEIIILNLNQGESPFFTLNKKILNYKLFDTNARGLSRFPFTIYKLRKFIKKNNIEIIINVDSILSLYTIPALINLNVKNICWEHFNYNVTLGKKIRFLSRILASKYSDKVIVLTNKDKIIWEKKTKSNKIIKISNPITIPSIKEIKSIKNKEKIIIAIGRLTHQKGFDLLLQSWSKITDNYPEWKLNIIGSGEEEFTLKKIIKLENIENSVSIIPPNKNIQKYYEQSSYYVLSSRFEGFGLVILEAQSNGLPVIAFNCEAGPDEIIIDNQTGWLCEKSNILELSEKISKAIELFESNKTEYLIFANNSIINSEKFSIENIIPSWIELFDNI